MPHPSETTLNGVRTHPGAPFPYLTLASLTTHIRAALHLHPDPTYTLADVSICSTQAGGMAHSCVLASTAITSALLAVGGPMRWFDSCSGTACHDRPPCCNASRRHHSHHSPISAKLPTRLPPPNLSCHGSIFGSQASIHVRLMFYLWVLLALVIHSLSLPPLHSFVLSCAGGVWEFSYLGLVLGAVIFVGFRIQSMLDSSLGCCCPLVRPLVLCSCTSHGANS